MRGFHKVTIPILIAATIACGGTGQGETNREDPQEQAQPSGQEPAGPSMISIDLDSNPTLPDDVSEQLYYGGLGGPGECYWLGDEPLPNAPPDQARYLSILDGAFEVCFWDYFEAYDLTNSSASMRLPDGSEFPMDSQISETMDGANELLYEYPLSGSWQQGMYVLSGELEGESWQYAFIPIYGYAFDTFQPNERVRLLFFSDAMMPAIFLGEIFTEASDEGLVVVEYDPDYPNLVIIAVGATSGHFYFTATLVAAGVQEIPFYGTPFIDEANPLETLEFSSP